MLQGVPFQLPDPAFKDWREDGNIPTNLARLANAQNTLKHSELITKMYKFFMSAKNIAQ